MPYLALAYVIYALLVGWFIGRLLWAVYETYALGKLQLSALESVPLVLVTTISISFIATFFWLAYLLSSRRRRRTAMILAAVSCIGIPVGTILGGLTLYTLTRADVRSEFAPTV